MGTLGKEAGWCVDGVLTTAQQRERRNSTTYELLIHLLSKGTGRSCLPLKDTDLGQM